jgi:thiol:disulfide interchange protein
MGKILIAIIFLSLSAFVAHGQASPAEKVVPQKRIDEFPREKFDPVRDPKADLEQAVGRAKISGKRVILDVGGEWCGWCKYMDKFFYQNANISRIRDENFIWVKINYSEENENIPFLSAYPAISGYPHLFVLDSDGTLLHSQPTDALEEEKGYNLAKFTEFLKTWSPRKEAAK